MGRQVPAVRVEERIDLAVDLADKVEILGIEPL
jgi:hypothetical protein